MPSPIHGAPPPSSSANIVRRTAALSTRIAAVVAAACGEDFARASGVIASSAFMDLVRHFTKSDFAPSRRKASNSSSVRAATSVVSLRPSSSRKPAASFTSATFDLLRRTIPFGMEEA
jgi:hypothetical protein